MSLSVIRKLNSRGRKRPLIIWLPTARGFSQGDRRKTHSTEIVYIFLNLLLFSGYHRNHLPSSIEFQYRHSHPSRKSHIVSNPSSQVLLSIHLSSRNNATTRKAKVCLGMAVGMLPLWGTCSNVRGDDFGLSWLRRLPLRRLSFGASKDQSIIKLHLISPYRQHSHAATPPNESTAR
ncbi:hypothetical protein DL98DRAFT_10360 [Cadophora sp. DSE1049]|nr:hypothetical protein DL98DRAFT_10360 [Cadophora sp. DSE1049]